MWIAHQVLGAVGPDPQNLKINPLESYDFTTFDGRRSLSGTRYWPKLWCDQHGNACGLGESGGPQESCSVQTGCAPSVDSKFEATFGEEGGHDWVDVGLIDGFTLPFKLEMKGDCRPGVERQQVASHVIDCSGISFGDCPVAEDLGAAGSSVDLKVHHPETNEVVGCYSPCSKLTLGPWSPGGSTALSPADNRTAPYCCPTPPASPEACRAGPVGRTGYVQAVHRMCSGGVYGYAYDDGVGMLKCSPDTRYDITFYCPSHVESPSAPVSPPSPELATIGREHQRTVAQEMDEKRASPSSPSTTASAPSTLEGRLIRWGGRPGKCFEVASGVVRNGTGLNLRNCTGSTGQLFQWGTDGKVRWSPHPWFCLDIINHKAWSGAGIQLWTCLGWDTDQIFDMPATGEGKIRWRNHKNLCFAVVDGTGDERPSLDFCSTAEDNKQHFTVDPQRFPVPDPAAAVSAIAAEPLSPPLRQPLDQHASLATESGRAVVAAQSSRRLRIINGCKTPLWIAHSAMSHGRLGTGPDPQDVRIEPSGMYDFETFDGLSGTSYWPKMRCDEAGKSCALGQSRGPAQVCSAAFGCAPPVDTKFEAIFGKHGEDWVDMSLVDGFTLPFKLELKGNCSANLGPERGSSKVIDCSQLNLGHCPAEERLEDGSAVNLRVVHPGTKGVVGCHSPCSKLTRGQWGDRGSVDTAIDSSRTAPYCCPTEQCRGGPVVDTEYVRAVHRMCPGVYSYAYDKGMGLLRCPADTHYEVTFYCPFATLPEKPGGASVGDVLHDMVIMKKDASGPASSTSRNHLWWGQPAIAGLTAVGVLTVAVAFVTTLRRSTRQQSVPLGRSLRRSTAVEHSAAVGRAAGDTHSSVVAPCLEEEDTQCIIEGSSAIQAPFGEEASARLLT